MLQHLCDKCKEVTPLSGLVLFSAAKMELTTLFAIPAPEVKKPIQLELCHKCAFDVLGFIGLTNGEAQIFVDGSTREGANA